MSIGPRRAWMAAGVAALISVIAIMVLGRGTTFTGDELVWIIASPGMDLKVALTGHGGHLQLVPRTVYRLMIEVFGLSYPPYRLLTALTVAGTGLLLFRHLLTRVPPLVALVPAVLVMFLGSDPLHLIRGNGFTIVFAMACGIAALLLVERRERRTDVAACAVLVLGAATYSVTLPFIAGVAFLFLLRRDWRRLWVPAVPLVLYGIWRVWVRGTETAGAGNSVHLDRILDIPAWTFDALAASMSALTGWGYGFTGLSSDGPGEFFGPLLAVLAILAVFWRLSRRPVRPELLVALVIALSLWTIQCLAADPASPDYRAPDDPRYLYPGAVVVILIGAEIAAGLQWRRAALVVLLAVGAFGLASNISQAERYGDIYRLEGVRMLDTITSAAIFFDETEGKRSEEPDEPVVTGDVGLMIATVARRPFGGVDYPDGQIAGLPDWQRADIDQTLAGYLGAELVRWTGGRVAGCRTLPEDGSEKLDGPVSIQAGQRPARILLGRFADESVDLGEVAGGPKRLLDLPAPLHRPAWSITARDGSAQVCAVRVVAGPAAG